MSKVLIVKFRLDEKELMNAVGNTCESIDDAISQELGWLCDSGFTPIEWEETEE